MLLYAEDNYCIVYSCDSKITFGFAFALNYAIIVGPFDTVFILT